MLLDRECKAAIGRNANLAKIICEKGRNANLAKIICEKGLDIASPQKIYLDRRFKAEHVERALTDRIYKMNIRTLDWTIWILYCISAICALIFLLGVIYATTSHPTNSSCTQVSE